MNIKSVLRTYSLLRQLTDDETALLETLRAMNDSEREALVETLSPQPARKSSTKKSASKKSSRASSLEQQIQKRGRLAISDTWENGDESCEHCQWPPDHNIHHLETTEAYHPFSPAAPTASDRSSANGGGGNSTANIGTGLDAVQTVVGGSSE